MQNSSTANPVPVVALYRRVSTQEQAVGGYSLDDQERVCREYLDRIYGPGRYVIKVFSDEGLSGKLGFARPGSSAKKIRPALSELVSEISQGRISVVIFWRLDRLSRSARVWLEFLQDYVLQYSITLISVQDRLDTSDSMGRFAAGILVLAAELFADITAENVKASMRRRRQDGYPTGQIGYGWRRTAREVDDE